MASKWEYLCWEWQRDDGKYSPFTPAESYFIETAFISGTKQHFTLKSVIDFDTMTATLIGEGVSRNVERVCVMSLTALPDIMAYWVWSVSPGEFVPYDMNASVDIELAYQNKVSTVDLSQCSCSIPYTVDFSSFKQTSHQNKTQRDVQRITLGISLQLLLKVPSYSPSSANFKGASGSDHTSANTALQTQSKMTFSSGQTSTIGVSSFGSATHSHPLMQTQNKSSYGASSTSTQGGASASTSALTHGHSQTQSKASHSASHGASDSCHTSTHAASGSAHTSTHCTSGNGVASECEYVFWEWQRDDVNYAPFTPADSHFLETSYISGAKQHVTLKYVIDFEAMTLSGGGASKNIVRIGVDMTGLPDIMAYWVWSVSPGEFVPYDMNASVDIELAYQNKVSTVDLSRCYCAFPYTVDFSNFKQTSHQFKTQRDVQRVALVQGVSLQSLLRILSPSRTSISSTQIASGSGHTSTQCASRSTQSKSSHAASASGHTLTHGAPQSQSKARSHSATSTHDIRKSSHGASTSGHTKSKSHSASTSGHTSTHGICKSSHGVSASGHTKFKSHSAATSGHTSTHGISNSSHSASASGHTKAKSHSASASCHTSTHGISSSGHTSTSHLALAQAHSHPLVQTSHGASGSGHMSTHGTSAFPSGHPHIPTVSSVTSKVSSVHVSQVSASTTTSSHYSQTISATSSGQMQQSKSLTVAAPPTTSNSGVVKPPSAPQAGTKAVLSHQDDDGDILASYDLADDILSSYSSTSLVPSYRAASISRSWNFSSLAAISKFSFGKAIRGAISTVANSLRYPSGWKSHPNSEEVVMVPLPENSAEYHRVETKFKKSLPRFTIIGIKRVQNRWLWIRYTQARTMLQRKNAGAVNEMELFHGSKATPSDYTCASEEGFDMRFSRPGLWGKANYFAVDAFYSHHYAYSLNDEQKSNEIILAKVLTGDSIECEPDNTLRFPPEKQGELGSLRLKQVRYDTVNGCTHGYRVYMTYSNDKAYPAYVITYAEGH